MKMFTDVKVTLGDKVIYHDKNSILWSGKAALLEMLFFEKDIKIDKVVVGDGGVSWPSPGVEGNKIFVEESFPENGEVCLNKVGEAPLAIVSSEHGNSADGWSKSFQAEEYSIADIVDLDFNANNTLKKVNNISVVVSGLPGFSIDGFSAGDDIPFSNITFPSVEFNNSIGKKMYISWLYKVV